MKPIDISRLLGLREETRQAGEAMDAMRPRFDALRSRHADGTAPQAVSSYQLFQTPVAIAKRLAALLELEPGARVLEPSAGIARLINEVLPFSPCEVVAVESSPECARHLYYWSLPKVTIRQRDFLTMTPDDTGVFNAVIMNPPFHMRSDIAHILHALKFLTPGGRLAAVCMNTKHRAKALKPLASHWEELPANTFAESGTNTPTVLLCIDAKPTRGEGAAL